MSTHGPVDLRSVRALLNAVLPALIAMALQACGHAMQSTARVMEGEAGRAVFDRVPASQRSPQIKVLYVTDRKNDGTTEHGPRYGYGRGGGASFGIATITVEPGMTWDDLVAASTTTQRTRTYSPRVTHIEEIGRFTEIMEMFDIVNGRLQGSEGLLHSLQSEYKALSGAMEEWSGDELSRDVVVFVHGFANTFDDAVLRMAEAWHMAGRRGIPIVFSWPAGSGGLTGYAYDRESGEFAVPHLKRLLVMLAATPKVERVHVIAHSRGTDVATTALRELHAEHREAYRPEVFTAVERNAEDEEINRLMSRVPTYESLKLETLVLAAPDIDVDVFSMRFFNENVLQAARRTVIYFSNRDWALGWAEWLFSGRARLGAVSIANVRPEVRARLAEITCLELIDVNVPAESSHAYMLHPAAFSDLIRLIAERVPAGSERRPLKRTEKAFWRLDDSYLQHADLGSGTKP